MLRNQGKIIYFSGLKTKALINGCATPLDHNHHEISLAVDQLKQSELTCLLVLFHELGHVEKFGKGEIEILDKITRVAAQLPDFESIREKVGSENHINILEGIHKQSLKELELHRLLAQNPLLRIISEEETEAVAIATNSLSEIIKVLKSPDYIPPKPILKLIQDLPYLADAFIYEHEKYANDYAAEQIRKIAPKIYDLDERLKTLMKLRELQQKTYAEGFLSESEK